MIDGVQKVPGLSDEVQRLMETRFCDGNGRMRRYRRSYDGVEVGILCETRKGFVAVEMKAAARWDKRQNRGLSRMREELGENRVASFGVFRGRHAETWGGIRVLQVGEFLRRPDLSRCTGFSGPRLKKIGMIPARIGSQRREEKADGAR